MLHSSHSSTLVRFCLFFSLAGVWLTASVSAYAGASLARRADERYPDCIYAAHDYRDSYPGGDENGALDVCAENIPTGAAAFASAAGKESNTAIFIKVVTEAQGGDDSCFFQVADCLAAKPDSPGECYPTAICTSSVDTRNQLVTRSQTRSACLTACSSLISPPNISGPPWSVILQIVGRGTVAALCVQYCNGLPA